MQRRLTPAATIFDSGKLWRVGRPTLVAVEIDSPLPPRVVEIAPSAWLQPFVRAYHHSVMSLGTSWLFKPVTARPELMLQFGLGEPFRPMHHATGAAISAPDVVLVGRQTRRNFNLLATGEVTTLTVHFQPAGFYRLFHLPAAEVTDQAFDAVDVLGVGLRDVHSRVQAADGVAAMVAEIEAFLSSRIEGRRPFHPVQAIAAGMLEREEGRRVGDLVAGHGLSARQFERVFADQVGMNPKLFARIIRFTRALQSKSEAPNRAWADVAAGAGYFDQSHFIRDCRTFGGGSPTSLMATWLDCRP